MHMTPKMREAEARLGKPLTEALVELFNQHGHGGAAKELRIPPPTLTFWFLRLGIETRNVAVPPGHVIKISKER